MQLNKIFNAEDIEVLFAQWENVTGVKPLLLDSDGSVAIGEGEASEYRDVIKAGIEIVGYLSYAKKDCEIFNSATMTLEEVIAVMERAEQEQKMTVRLHTGEPSIYGAVREQMDALDRRGIPWDVTPGVSSFCGAAAALGAEYTLPGVSQTVIITRMAGRTPVPQGEEIASLARQPWSSSSPPGCWRHCLPG